MRIILTGILLLAAAILGVFIWINRGALPAEDTTGLPLILPEDYSISIFASNLGSPRVLTFDSKGTLLTSVTSSGRVVALPDKNGDGVADETKTVVSGLRSPHGLAFDENKLYIAEENQVAVYDYDAVNFTAKNKRKIVDLPAGSGHFTRTLLIHGGKLFISVGSSCNVCIEEDERRAKVLVSNLDGSDLKTYADGLRNAVFMKVNPKTREIWLTEMGRDHLGDNLPPDEINILKESAHFGWPYCYGGQILDTEFDSTKADFCKTTVGSHFDIPAHSAPLGLDFLGDDLLVAYHGSWNRSIPTGYKVVRFKPNGEVEDFITGWLIGSGEVLGRPADILVEKEKAIYISDDKAGVIYLLKRG